MDRSISTTRFIEPKPDVRDRISVELGDSKQAEFKPQTKVMRWDNEVNLSVRLVHDETRATVEETSGLVKWRGERQEAHFYELPVSDLHPEGASEVEILLLMRPASNVVRFTLSTKGLTFYRQEMTDNLRKMGVEIPDHILGSYAVYADTPKTNYTNGKLYRSGKVGHIYRPFVIDANGNGVWGDLRVDRGMLTVTIPQDFIDSAAYPIRHAAGLTFGYTGVGSIGFGQSTASNTWYGGGSAASAGDASKITFYSQVDSAGSTNLKGVMWKQSDNAVVTNGVSNVTAINSTTAQWWDFPFSTPPAIAAVGYNFGTVVDPGSSIDTKFYADIGGGVGEQSGSVVSYASPGSLSPGSGLSLNASIYITYTEAGGTLPPFRTSQAVRRASFY